MPVSLFTDGSGLPTSTLKSLHVFLWLEGRKGWGVPKLGVMFRNSIHGVLALCSHCRIKV